MQRGDALRNIIRHSGTPVVRLAEVLRQRNEADRRFSRLLATGAVAEAFGFADRRGLICESADDNAMFAQAAEHYVSNRVRGIETLVVIPFWEEIERFNAQVRPALRQAGLLGEAQDIEVVKIGAKGWREAPRGFRDVLEARRHALVTGARATGAALFAEKPKAWMKQLSPPVMADE